MKTYKSYKFKLHPNEEQTAMLHQHGGNLRFAWNNLLDFANEKRSLSKTFPSKSELRAKLKEIQKENLFMKCNHSQPLQDVSDNLFDTFIKAIKPEMVEKRNKKIAKANQITDETKRKKELTKALNFGFPKFKRKSDFHDSIFYPQSFKIRRSKIFFPKMGWINYNKHRQMEGVSKFLTIVQNGNDWYVAITNEVEIKEIKKPAVKDANIVGIDLGLKTFATLSDGTEIESPKALKHKLKKLKREQRRLSRKQLKNSGEKKFGKEIKVSSKNRDKQVLKVLSLHKKIENIRNNFLHKTSKQIITKFDGVVLETLDIQNLLKINGKATNRSIMDASWYRFSWMLDYKSKWLNKYFIKTDKYDPTTQECNQCHKLQHLSLKQRVYICPHCGYTCGRDLNAAFNIRDHGIEMLKVIEETENNTRSTRGINACGEDDRVSLGEARRIVIGDKTSAGEIRDGFISLASLLL